MTSIGEIFLVDDEEEIRFASRQTFELEGYSVRTFASAPEALNALSANWLGVVITDVKMPGMDGLALLSEIRERFPEIPVVIQTGHGDVPMALSAMRAGAYDFVEKPVPPEYLLDVAERALAARRLTLENRGLKKRIGSDADIRSRVIGTSQAAVFLRETLSSLAMIDVDVLLIGETGVGKELAARCLHDLGFRKDGEFVAVNCGAIPANLVESELFGHERGAFTGAVSRRIGKIEQAQGGTLFLDEIESMPLEVQVKVLRALQERTVERVGGNTPISVDFRVIAASKVDLRKAAVVEGTFREDLFYRLNVARVVLPPLRDRGEDTQVLLEHFIAVMASRFERPEPVVDPALLTRLSRYLWPGNVRELRNVAKQLVLGLMVDLSDTNLLSLPDAGTERSGNGNGKGLDEQVRLFEKHLIEQALERNGYSMTRTSEDLGIPRKRLYLRMQKFGITKP